MAITNNALSISEELASKSGAVKPAAVIIATVEEPCAVLIAAAKRKGSQMLKLILAKVSPMID